MQLYWDPKEEDYGHKHDKFMAAYKMHTSIRNAYQQCLMLPDVFRDDALRQLFTKQRFNIQKIIDVYDELCFGWREE